MATSISFTIPEFQNGSSGPDYPKLLTLKAATETAVDAAIAASLATSVATPRKVQVRVPVVPATPTKRFEITIPVKTNGNSTATFSPPVGATITAYKFTRGANAGGTLTVALDRITKSTGAVETALSTAASVAAGTNDVEQAFTPSVAISGSNHALTSAQSLKITVAADNSNTIASLTFIIEYTDTSAVSGKGQATWFPGRAVSVTGITACLTETFVGASIVANLSDVVATTGVLVPLGTSQSLAALVQDVETAYVPDEAAGALPYALTALKGLRFEVVADATTKAPNEVTFTITYVDTVI